MDKRDNVISQFSKEKGYDPEWIKRITFTNILVCSNMMQTMFSRTQDGLTSKQWLLLIIAENVGNIMGPLTLSEAGLMMGCSRQNVKQIAEILNKNGYLEFTKKEGDKNTVRIVPTEKWYIYEKENQEFTFGILDDIFYDFSPNELEEYFNAFRKVIKNINKINNKLKGR